MIPLNLLILYVIKPLGLCNLIWRTATILVQNQMPFYKCIIQQRLALPYLLARCPLILSRADFHPRLIASYLVLVIGIKLA